MKRKWTGALEFHIGGNILSKASVDRLAASLIKVSIWLRVDNLSVHLNMRIKVGITAVIKRNKLVNVFATGSGKIAKYVA
jgi:hypothetical protein